MVAEGGGFPAAIPTTTDASLPGSNQRYLAVHDGPKPPGGPDSCLAR
jgi:hypothetical protein